MQDVLNAATLGSIYLLFALGMALTWGTIGILNFAHGATFMFAALTTHLVAEHAKLPVVVVLLLSMAVGAAISVATQVLAFQPIIKRSTKENLELRIIIGGVGVSAIPLAIAQRVTNDSPFGFNTSYHAKVMHVAGMRLTTTSLVVLVLGIGLGIALSLWLQRSRHGLALRAIGADAETSRGMGVNGATLALLTMAVGGALAGMAGALLTLQLGALSPESGDTLLIKAFAIVVLGGLGSMAGVIIGSYVLAAIETLIVVLNYGTWVDAVSFGLIFVILLLRPQGILGRQEVRRT